MPRPFGLASDTARPSSLALWAAVRVTPYADSANRAGSYHHTDGHLANRVADRITESPTEPSTTAPPPLPTESPTSDPSQSPSRGRRPAGRPVQWSLRYSSVRGCQIRTFLVDRRRTGSDRVPRHHRPEGTRRWTIADLGEGFSGGAQLGQFHRRGRDGRERRGNLARTVLPTSGKTPDVRRLTVGPDTDAKGSPLAGDDRVVFSRNGDIYMIAASGGPLRCGTNSVRRSAPTVSPDL